MTKKTETPKKSTARRVPAKRKAKEVYVLESSVARNRHERERDECAAARLAIEAQIKAIQEKANADAKAIIDLAEAEVANLSSRYKDLHVVELASIAALQSMEQTVGDSGSQGNVVPLKIERS